MTNTTSSLGTTLYKRGFHNFGIITKERIHIIIHSLIYIFLALSISLNSTIITSIVTIFIIIYFVFSSPDEHFFFLVGFVPFEHIARIGNINAFFILLFLSVTKLMTNNINGRIKKGGLISLLVLVTLEIFNDFGSVTNGELLIVLSTIIYFCFFVLLLDKKFFDTTKIIINFCISYVVVIIQVISEYRSINEFFQRMSKDTQIIRFGDEAISIGGAMGIPLYSALVISMLISYYVIKPSLNLKKKLLIVSYCSMAFVFGILTISRSFLLTMATWIIFFLLSGLDKQRRRIKILKIIPILITLSVIVYSINSDVIIDIVNDFLIRANKDAGTGIRGQIWESCFNYLNRHSFGYLFGYGIRNYVVIGYNYNFLFSLMAHNLYIDIIMSMGIVGLISLIYLIYLFKLKIKKIITKKSSLITTIPLLVFLVFGLTALSLNNFKTWIYALMLIIFSYSEEERRSI